MPPVLRLCMWLALASAPLLRGADETESLLKNIVRAARAGDQETVAPLKDLHTAKLTGDAVLSLVGDKKVGLGIKLRLAEIVAAWPTGVERATLADWLLKHPACDDDTLLFFANCGLPEARGLFWGILTQVKGPLSKLRDPERVALAARALGAFPDNPENVVTHIATLLDPACAHVLRACAAEALGGMHHLKAIEALLPQLDDDPAMNMAAFYGMEIRAKGALFILDISGSMTQDGRINKLTAQMSNLLSALQTKSDKLRYGILTFGENVESCFSSRGIAVNDVKNHKQAVRFVERITADGGTPMCEVLSLALTKILPDANIDAIYFLSDGSPSDGTPQYVLELATRIHQKFQTRIHTISIGEEPSVDLDKPSLLNQIANACGGTFTIPP